MHVGGQKSFDPLELEFQGCEPPYRVLGTKPRFLAEAIRFLMAELSLLPELSF